MIYVGKCKYKNNKLQFICWIGLEGVIKILWLGHKMMWYEIFEIELLWNKICIYIKIKNKVRNEKCEIGFLINTLFVSINWSA